VKLPLAYLPLAKGDALLYLIMEGAYAVFYITLTIFFYQQYGLSGVGIAILVCAVIDFAMLYITMHFKYGYVQSRKVTRYILLQFPVGILAYAATYIQDPVIYWTTGCLLTILSTWISFVILRRKTSLWKRLKEKFSGK
jgi:O-antigen/teichoic acid export membrane protein